MNLRWYGPGTLHARPDTQYHVDSLSANQRKWGNADSARSLIDFFAKHIRRDSIRGQPPFRLTHRLAYAAVQVRSGHCGRD